jgi:ADP-heptose:LPS heptosyltransferase
LGKSYEEVSRLFSDGIFIRSHIDQYYTQNKIGVIPQLWLSGTYRVALIMGSIQPHKRWPTPKFESLALELSKKKGIRVMLLGTDQFREDAEKIAQKNPLVISSLCGKTTLLELSVVLLKAHVCVGSDGGGVHLSAALGTPTVSLVPGIEPVGSVDPFGWERLSLRKAVECAPCRSFQCCPQGHHRCMNEIKLSDVMTNILIDLYKNDNKD